MLFGLKINTDLDRRSNHHHPHLHKKHDGKEKDPQSAHPYLQPNEVGTKSEGMTPEQSREGSRRTSVHDLSGWEKIAFERGILEKKSVKEGEVREERERSALRAAYVYWYSGYWLWTKFADSKQGASQRYNGIEYPFEYHD